MHPYKAVGESEETSEIVFTGSWSVHRERWLARLSDLPITVYGSAWARAIRRLRPTRLRCDVAVPIRERYASTIASAKVALNILDPHNCPGTNMRTLEIPGSGGVMCSTWTEDVEALFPEGAVSTFRTEEELRYEISRLLRDQQARLDVRRRSHAIAERNTYDVRARDLIELFEELILSATP
jgi:spore maturation protein CgeB